MLRFGRLLNLATIIDALLVTFGIDITGYKKGQQDATKSLTDFQRKQKAASEDLSKGLLDVGRSISTLFLGFESATGLAKWLGGLNKGEADLGRFARNVGQSGHELNKWGQATELAGGKAEDALDVFSKLTTEATNLKVSGFSGPLLTLLRARGVAVLDENNNLRNQGQIMEDLADKTAQYGVQYQHTLFAAAGIAESEINYLTLSKDKREELLTLAEANNRVNEDAIKRATELQQKWREIGQDIKGAGQRLLEVAQVPASMAAALVKNGVDVFSWNVKDTLDQGDVDALNGLDPYANPNAQPTQTRSVPAGTSTPYKDTFSFADTIKKFSQAGSYASGQASRTVDPVQKADLLATIAATEQALGIPAGLLARIANQESRFRPDIISGATKSSAGAVGLMQLMPKDFPDAGKDAKSDINSAGAYLTKLYHQFGSWDLAVAAYNDGPGNIRKVLAGKKSLPAETANYEQNVMGGPTPLMDMMGASPSHSTDVDVGQINIYPHPGQSPGQIAAMVPAAIERKMSVSQAATGQS